MQAITSYTVSQPASAASFSRCFVPRKSKTAMIKKAALAIKIA